MMVLKAELKSINRIPHISPWFVQMLQDEVLMICRWFQKWRIACVSLPIETVDNEAFMCLYSYRAY